MALHPDRYFPCDPTCRAIARRLYGVVSGLPIVSPHGHTEPAWYADNLPFSDPATLFIKPDHYVFRLLYSHGVPLEELGVGRLDGEPVETDSRKIWRILARHWPMFRSTPSRYWLEHTLETVFGVEEKLCESNADRIHDMIADRLKSPEMRPRSLYEKFNIEAIATTDAATDDLASHDSIRRSQWQGRVLPTYRPDAVVDPDQPDFSLNVQEFVALAGTSMTYPGYLEAHRIRRSYFKSRGATATDHGHPSALTASLPAAEAARLFERAMSGTATAHEAEMFRGQLLTEMARMSLDDGLALQIRSGPFRNHNRDVMRKFGRDKGADIPKSTDFVHSLKPLLDRFGNEKRLTIILFTLDESTYARELAPLAGHYPCLRLGPAWWFYDSPDGMLRYRELTTETCGFYKTAGFNDDTRAFLSIPARHDMSRRIDCGYLARLVAEHRLDEDDAAEVAVDLAYRLAKRTYNL
ncbi:MAG: glucuronate isomerase [Parvibaculaceae bacterium]